MRILTIVAPKQVVETEGTKRGDLDLAAGLASGRLDLSAAQVEVAVWFIDGETEEQIAEWLGITQQAAHARIERIRGKLAIAGVRLTRTPLMPHRIITADPRLLDIGRIRPAHEDD